LSGNTTHRFRNTALLSVSRVEAPVVVSSAELDTRLGDVYERVGLRAGLSKVSSGSGSGVGGPRT